MSVHVYTPGAESPLGGHALLIALHGCTQSATQLRDFGNFEHAAEDFGMVIALPDVPGGGVFAGCWNYYGALHNAAGGHEAAVISMTDALLGDGALGIDPAQVYLSGFSSGGGEALVVGCLAPERFAGIGTAAGPSLGTEATQIAQVGQTAEGAKTLCMQYAGGGASALDSQLAVAFTDSGDIVVAQGYAAVNADMFASIYGAATSAPFDLSSVEGAMPAGQGTEYADGVGPRVALLQSTSGGGHAWPAGSGNAGGGISYVAGTGVDFAYFLATFFTANNRRAEGDWNPGGDDDDGGSSDGAGEDAGPADDGDSGDGAADDGTADDDGDGPDDGGDEGGDDDPSGAGEGGFDGGRIEPSGCQCSASVNPPSLVALPSALFGALFLRRRRRA
jgi:poly(3-hydroxybutyrate) depolymerase